MIKGKLNVINNATTLLNEREMVYSCFNIGIFPLPNRPTVAEPEKSSSSEHLGD